MTQDMAPNTPKQNPQSRWAYGRIEAKGVDGNIGDVEDEGEVEDTAAINVPGPWLTNAHGEGMVTSWPRVIRTEVQNTGCEVNSAAHAKAKAQD